MTSCNKVGGGWVNSKKKGEEIKHKRWYCRQLPNINKVTLLMLGNLLVVVLVLTSCLVFRLDIAKWIIGIQSIIITNNARGSGRKWKLLPPD